MNPFEPGTEEYRLWEQAPEPEPYEDDEISVEVAAEAHKVRVQRKARRLVDAEEHKSAEIPEALSLRERLARPTPPMLWRIDQWQPMQARVVVAAQYKAGKTTLLGNGIRCLVDGDPFLGQYKVNVVTGTVVLLDFEMSPRQLDQWLREQRIVNDDKVMVFPMRGLASAFDIVNDPGKRARWVDTFTALDTAYVALDCLRPVLDALGLDEHHDAGRFLTAFDEVLTGAGVGEALVVHHMGHSGERSRGDSRLRDWPDVEWRLVRQDEDPASPRYITAYGRDVEVAESQLAYDRASRRLTIVGGSRDGAQVRAVLDAVIEYLDAHPRSSKAAIERAFHDHRNVVRAALPLGISDGKLVVEITKKAHLYSNLATSPHLASTSPNDVETDLATSPPRICGEVVEEVVPLPFDESTSPGEVA